MNSRNRIIKPNWLGALIAAPILIMAGVVASVILDLAFGGTIGGLGAAAEPSHSPLAGLLTAIVWLGLFAIEWKILGSAKNRQSK